MRNTIMGYLNSINYDKTFIKVDLDDKLAFFGDIEFADTDFIFNTVYNIDYDAGVRDGYIYLQLSTANELIDEEEYYFPVSNAGSEGCSNGYIKLRYKDAKIVNFVANYHNWVLPNIDEYDGWTTIDIDHAMTIEEFESKFFNNKEEECD
jgi:hypothetical protein